MMGRTHTAIITFEGTKVPCDVFLLGGKYSCRLHQPRQQACGECLSLGHRTDVCPQPKQNRCTSCGAPGVAMKDYEYTAHFANCGGEHVATDHRGSTRQRTPYNEGHVTRYQRKKGQQQRTPPYPPHCYHTLPCRAATGRNCQVTTAT